ncbi:hypothetical protein SNE40_010264 [Patella caerulea]|uniref:Uncharacterized protein n=1 Tax=Patella caerulea TaxID=87958 RepID=A0AAN8PRF6_PATCE
MYRLLVNDSAEKPILAIKSDGGPDHRLTYLSVKVSLIALFVALDLTCLIAIRTAPHQSYRNPVERCMSTLNLGLQFISLMRDKLDEKSEQLLSKANSMSDIRKCAEQNPGMQEKILQSTKPCVDLLNEVFQRLEYTERPVKTYDAVSKADIECLWEKALLIDPNQLQMTHMKKYKDLQTFIEVHCRERNYTFSIKKCVENPCGFCLAHPPTLPESVFSSVYWLPDPVPGSEGHYKSFSDLYGTVTSEEHRPSLNTTKAKKDIRKRKKSSKVGSIFFFFGDGGEGCKLSAY